MTTWSAARSWTSRWASSWASSWPASLATGGFPPARPSTRSTKSAPSSPAVARVRASGVRQIALHAPAWKPCSCHVGMSLCIPACFEAGVATSPVPVQMAPAESAASTLTPATPWCWHRALSWRCGANSLSSSSALQCTKLRRIVLLKVTLSSIMPTQERPSSPTASECTPASPLMIESPILSQVFVLHSRSVPSSERVWSVASSGEKQAAQTGCGWPRSVATRARVTELKTRTILPWAAMSRWPPLANFTKRMLRTTRSRYGFSSSMRTCMKRSLLSKLIAM
mmetsp:Transcript_71610/g.210281  ORF Transcript_71610/g.210281 Transcript_71610/m.210281 type:complete len:283 (+) Transcript_71610:1880-2728(+)